MTPSSARRATLVAGVVVVALSGSLLASSSPDGLERVAQDLGFEHRAQELYQAPLADYRVPVVPMGWSGCVAGLLGAGVVGLLAWGTGRLLALPQKP